MPTQQKIAIFRALQLGDMLCVIPAVRSIRKALPLANITLISLPWAKVLLQRFPNYFDDFIPFPGYPGLPEQQVTPSTFTTFLKTVQEKQFDLVLQMQGNGTIVNSLVELFGAQHTAGFYTEESYRPNAQFYFPYPSENHHEIHRWLSLITSLGIPSTGAHLEFPLFATDIKESTAVQERFTLKEKKYICIHPGARDPRRRIAPQIFATVADVLFSQGYTVVFTGTKEEKSIITAIQKHMRYAGIDLSGQTSLGGLGALLAKSRLLIANDTGVSHIASALQLPSIICFSPYSDPKRWAPLDKKIHHAILPHVKDKKQLVSEILDHVFISERMILS